MPGGRGGGGMYRKPGSGRGGGMGSLGQCVCIKCGFSSPKNAGIPCMKKKCPNCGNVLLRGNGAHYNRAKKRNKEV